MPLVLSRLPTERVSIHRGWNIVCGYSCPIAPVPGRPDRAFLGEGANILAQNRARL